jgi:hypothetical protein
MHALVLVVKLIAAASAVEPQLRLAPQLALALLPGDAAASAVEPELQLTPLRDDAVAPAAEPASLGAAPTRRGLRGGEWVAAAGTTVAGDALLGAMTAVGFALAFSSFTSSGSSASSGIGASMIAVSGIGFLFLPPAFAVWGAEKAGAPPDREGAAYWYGFLTRLGAVGAGYYLASRGSPRLATGVWFASETVLMPYVVARTLGDVPVPQLGGTPLALALPVRDPALAR